MEGLSENLEDYLETILHVETSNKVARVKDIAAHMGVLRGAVTQALKKLSHMGLINYEPYSFITLTPKGLSIAKKISQHHKIIKDFLITVLQVPAEKAELNACRIEHAMDPDIVNRLVVFMENIRNNSKVENDGIKEQENQT